MKKIVSPLMAGAGEERCAGGEFFPIGELECRGDRRVAVDRVLPLKSVIGAYEHFVSPCAGEEAYRRVGNCDFPRDPAVNAAFIGLQDEDRLIRGRFGLREERRYAFRTIGGDGVCSSRRVGIHTNQPPEQRNRQQTGGSRCQPVGEGPAHRITPSCSASAGTQHNRAGGEMLAIQTGGIAGE